MRAFVTGGTGFLGSRLVERLRSRGDDVTALVRSLAAVGRLEERGCRVVLGDLSSPERLADTMRGCDAVFHAAADYRIGIPASQRAAMYETNVRGTENVFDAAAEAGVRRIVYVSTNSVVGNTRGRVVDETYERPRGQGFLSAYDETKLLAHETARGRIARGAPILVAQPGGIYGPGDHTEVGAWLERAAAGRPVLLPLGGVGLNWVHVDDAAGGLVLVHEHGRVGETYILGGEIATLRDAVRAAYAAGGHRPWIVPVPTVVLRVATPLGPLLGRDVREVLSASDGVTYWGSDEKARRELGYAPRDLVAGLRDAFRGTVAGSR